MKKKLLAASALSLSLSVAAPAFAADADVLKRIDELQQQIELLKRQQEVQDEKNVAAAEKAAIVEFGKKGLKVNSPDKKYELTVGGTFQLDGRTFLGDDSAANGKNEIIARRLRPTIEGKAGDASFRLMPDFGGSTVRVFDAHVDYKLNDDFKFRAGKFKTPVSLERLQSAADLTDIERGHPTNLAPNRDFGVMLYGNPILDVVEYQIGIFNGNQDGGNTDTDADDKKDVAGRIFLNPWRNADTVALQNLGFGVGGSYGERDGSSTNTILGTYKTPGQQDFFAYRAGTFADGTQWRLYPQTYWSLANVSLLAEYAISDQEVTRATFHDDLQQTAWQLAGSYVLTGEDINFKGGIKPYQDFSYLDGGLGAWEVTARVGATDVDDDAFTQFADITTSASKAQSYGAGLNWYLNENFKLMANYDYTTFEGGAAAGGDRQDEQAVFTRAQFRF